MFEKIFLSDHCIRNEYVFTRSNANIFYPLYPRERLFTTLHSDEENESALTSICIVIQLYS